MHVILSSDPESAEFFDLLTIFCAEQIFLNIKHDLSGFDHGNPIFSVLSTDQNLTLLLAKGVENYFYMFWIDTGDTARVTKTIGRIIKNYLS